MPRDGIEHLPIADVTAVHRQVAACNDLEHPRIDRAVGVGQDRNPDGVQVLWVPGPKLRAV